jgi:hypothetical protein
VVIKDKGQVVGTQGMIPIYINIHGKKYFSGKSESSLLDHRYRGGTLFQDLYEFGVSKCKSNQMYCIWGFTSAGGVWRKKLKFKVYENSIKEAKVVLNLGATIFNTIRSKINIVRTAFKSQKTTLGKSASALIDNMRGLKSFLKKPEGRSSGEMPSKKTTPAEKYEFELMHKLKAPKDIQDLYSRLRKKNPKLIHMNLEKKYIEWRVYKNPMVKYKSLFVYENNKLLGYCFYNIRSDRTCNLVDLTFETPATGRYLLTRLLDELREKKLAYLQFFGNIDNPLMNSVFRLLTDFGAKINNSSQYFVLRNLSYSDDEELYNIKNWYLNGLWTEGFN